MGTITLTLGRTTHSIATHSPSLRTSANPARVNARKEG
jgi:hypothetical protein